VNDNGNLRHKNTTKEFDCITDRLLKEMRELIQQEDDPTFVIVSEDPSWKHEMTNKIRQIAVEEEKTIQILKIDYSDENYMNYNSVLDLFCLSKCKQIWQGVKYSTFSLTSALLGNGKIRNYSEYLPGRPSLMDSWSSAVEINGKKNFDIEYHNKITEGIQILETNVVGNSLL
jgi:hypothetical protein